MDWNGGKGQKKVEHGGVCYMLYVQNFLKSIPYSLSTLSESPLLQVRLLVHVIIMHVILTHTTLRRKA